MSRSCSNGVFLASSSSRPLQVMRGRCQMQSRTHVRSRSHSSEGGKLCADAMLAKDRTVECSFVLDALRSRGQAFHSMFQSKSSTTSLVRVHVVLGIPEQAESKFGLFEILGQRQRPE